MSKILVKCALLYPVSHPLFRCISIFWISIINSARLCAWPAVGVQKWDSIPSFFYLAINIHCVSQGPGQKKNTPSHWILMRIWWRDYLQKYEWGCGNQQAILGLLQKLLPPSGKGRQRLIGAWWERAWGKAAAHQELCLQREQLLLDSCPGGSRERLLLVGWIKLEAGGQSPVVNFQGQPPRAWDRAEEWEEWI